MAYSFNPFAGGLDDSGTPGIPDGPSDNLVYGRKNGQWFTHTKEDLVNAESGPYLTLIINGDNTVTGVEGNIGSSAYYDYGMLGLQIGRSCTTIGDGAFGNGYAVSGSLIIPDSVTSIGIASFQASSYNGSLYLGSNITSIGDSAFFNCSGFTGSLVIPNSVTSIGSYAFRYCSGFTGSLTIPNSVTSIGSYAFGLCSGFTGSLTIGNSVTSIGSGAFSFCYNFTGSLTIPNSVTGVGSAAFAFCPGFTGSLTIGNNVTNIGSYAFNDCSGFTGSLTIPNSVTSIGSYAFYNCTGFTNVNCYITKTIIDSATNIFLNTGITTIHARSTDATWTAGPGQSIGGQSGITVIKDL